AARRQGPPLPGTARRVPARPAGQAGLGAGPLPWMRHGMRRLEQAGAAAIAIPCNTAHVWYPQLAQAAAVPVLHIVQAVLDDLRRQGIHAGRIGLLATATTLRLGPCPPEMLAPGYEPVVPTARL